jgi:hypothetical protein
MQRACRNHIWDRGKIPRHGMRAFLVLEIELAMMQTAFSFAGISANCKTENALNHTIPAKSFQNALAQSKLKYFRRAR